jgi:phasin
MASKKSIAAAAVADATLAEPAFVAESAAANEDVPARVDTPTVTAEAPVAPVEAAVTPFEAPAASVETAAAAPPALSLVSHELAKALETPVKSMSAMHEKVREMIEKTFSESQANYAKVKSAADETNTALETSFATAKSGVAEINAKLLESLRATADANFEFVKSVFAVKTVADYVALHGEFARKQIESMTSQTKALSELARKVAVDTVEPIKTQVTKTFKAAA